MLRNLFPGKSARPLAHGQRLQFLSIITIFTGLGFFVGVWAVLTADLVNALKLTSEQLGFALSCFPCAGIVILLFGGVIAERMSRRLILLFGIGGIGLFFLALALVPDYTLLLVALLFGGACGSFYDLAINTIGNDYERHYATKNMPLFHAGFSAGAALGACVSAVMLSDDVSFRIIYATAAFLFLLLTAATLVFPLPPIASTVKTDDEHTTAVVDKRSSSFSTLLAIPIVLLATLIVGLAFYTDGSLEGYISVYLRDLLGSGVLLGGIGIAVFYLVGMVGKIGSTVFLRRYGERMVVTISALLSALGMLLMLSTTSTLLAVLGLLFVGLGQAPLVPTAFSLTAQVEARQGAHAVAIVTACGYTVFLVGPPIIGLLATLFSLRIALLSTIVTSVCIMLIAQRLPGARPVARQNSQG